MIASQDELTYGDYKVVVTARYASLFDFTGTGSYTVYFDGVRVYNPAQGLDEKYYSKDHEAWPVIIELRKCLLSQAQFKQAQVGETVSGAVFMDGVGIDGSVEDYTSIGPNNEIYLNPGQAVAFQLKCSGTPDDILDGVQFSVKTIQGANAKGNIITDLQGEGSLQIVGASFTREISAISASERYYDLGLDHLKWVDQNDGTYLSEVIVLQNPAATGGATLSFRNLKVTFKSAPDANATEPRVEPVMTNSGGNRAKALLSSGVVLESGTKESYVKASLSGDELSYTLDIDPPYGSKLIVARYDDGKVTDIQVVSSPEKTGEMTVEGTGTTYRIFLLDEGNSPLCNLCQISE